MDPPITYRRQFETAQPPPKSLPSGSLSVYTLTTPLLTAGWGSPAQPETLNDPVHSPSQPFLPTAVPCTENIRPFPLGLQNSVPSRERSRMLPVRSSSHPPAVRCVPCSPISPHCVPAHGVALWVWDTSRKLNWYQPSLQELCTLAPSRPKSVTAETEHKMVRAVAHG